MLQKYRQPLLKAEKALYLSADSVFITPYSLLEISEVFYQQGGKYLLIDEIHHYKNWQAEVKTIYDSFPDLHLILTGSSSLNIILSQYDLSRRSRIYNLWGLSLREFVNLKLSSQFEPFTLKDIFSSHVKQATKIKQEVEKRGGKILQLFRQYLRFGYHPYFLAGEADFLPKLENFLEKVLYEDIALLFSFTPESIVKVKKLLTLIATSSPFTVNVERFSASLATSKSTIYNFFDILQKASLIHPLQQKDRGYARVRKPHKVYLDNPNLYPLLTGKIDINSILGSLLECFLVNQVSKKNLVTAGKKVDFVLEEDFKVEVGGRSKKTVSSDIWMAKDGIEIGTDREIPLYLFGFLY